MGCVSSQQHTLQCRHCQSQEPFTKRSFSVNLRRTFSRKKECYHMVHLNSLKLDPSSSPNSRDPKRFVNDHHHHHCSNEKNNGRKNHDHDLCCSDEKKDYATKLIEAKKWSKMMDKKIPKVEPKSPTRMSHDGGDSSSTLETSEPKPKKESRDFKHEVTCAFRKALGDLPPSNPFYVNPLEDNQHVVEEKNVNGVTSIELIEEKKINGDIVEEKRVNVVVSSAGCAQVNNVQKADIRIQIPIGYPHLNRHVEKDKNRHEKVILFFTSLRGVRKTYEDCCYVRVILKGLGVRVDEKDVSMHSGYKDELKELLGDTVSGGLPTVFVGEKYIGGKEEIQKMNEDGILGMTFQECEILEDDSGNLNGVCEGCDDIRFVPCETCSGSCKIFQERAEYDNKESKDRKQNGFKRCPDCNENGLVRCPMCSSSSS